MSKGTVNLLTDDFESRNLSWEDIESFISRRWKLVLLAFLATCLGTYTALQLMTDRYESSADVMVKIGRENSEIPSTVQNSGLVTGGVNEQVVNSEIQILSSRSLVESVVDKIGVAAFQSPLVPPTSWYKLPKYYAKVAFHWVKKQGNEVLIAVNLKRRLTKREAAVTAVADSLQVQPEKNSQVISLHLELPDPELGKRVLSELVQLYLIQHSKVYQDPDVNDFFDAQLTGKEKELQELLAKREETRNQYALSSVSEQRSLLLKQLSDINTQMDMNQSEEAMLGRQKELMKTRLLAVPAELKSSEVQTQNPSIQSIKDRITTLQLEHAKLASRYIPNAGPLVKNEEEIAELKALLQKEEPTLLGNVTSELNPVRLNFDEGIEQNEIKIQGLEAKSKELLQPLGQIKRRLKDLNVGEDQLHNIDLQIGLAEQSYKAYAKDLEESRISQQLDIRRIANVSVLSAPSSSFEPVYPRKLLIMGLAIPFGLLLGLALGLVAEYMDDTIRSSRDLEDLDGLPCLGSFRISVDSKDLQSASVGD
ncbi:MAG: GumC family protein [Candidatus Acidiferrum sp.]